MVDPPSPPPSQGIPTAARQETPPRPSLRDSGPGRLAAAAHAQAVRHALPGDLRRWLDAGWRDLMATRGRSFALGLAYGLALVAVAVVLPATGAAGWVSPAMALLLLVAPLPGCAFFALSRDVEQGRRPRLGAALLAWRVAPGRLLGVGVVLALAFLMWERGATLLFALMVPNVYAGASAEAVQAALGAGHALGVLAAMLALGAVLSVAVFIGGAMALPLMFDRGVDIWTGLFVSALAFFGSWKTMLGLAITALALTLAGLLMGVVGLAITLPVAAHAVWHAYRGLVAWP